MYNTGKVIVGIIVFVLFFSLPFWINLGRLEAVPKPELPVEEKKCVESKEYMRAYHMKLLSQWRDDKVRKGKVYYVNSQGEKYKMSLQQTCMKCHKDRSKFCDRCHDFFIVKTDCWNCHIAPEEVKKWQ